MLRSTHLLGLGLATPETIVTREEALSTAQTIFGERLLAFPQFARVFVNSGIETRYIARPLSWYAQPHGWQDRMAVYQEVAGALFLKAARKALVDAKIDAQAVDCVVVASSTGFATPGLEANLAAELGLRADVERVPLFGLGCAAGVSGLTIAARMAEAREGRTVLFVTMELCSMAFRSDDASRANLIATALFGDGAAACVLSASSDARGFASIIGAGQHLFPDSRLMMGWRIDNSGFGIELSASLPAFVRSELPAAVEQLLQQCGVSRKEIERFICHPGGAKVLQAFEEVLDLHDGALDHERAVLAAYGNMSAPTVLFVLERARKAGLAQNAAMLALGPGFSANMIVLQRNV
ncbi:type III polyketide synthase [Rhizobium sp.]|uniref:type III polyketide synthase n=1 Tax=Rhizobium sp. TaxID=391 RepID=UPI000E7E2A7E|nr:type III polyketide synthase [Rhizobium sp.]